MGRTEKTMDRVRRGVDDTMIFTSLLLLAWPALFEDVVRGDAGAPGLIIGVVTVVCLGLGVIMLAGRRPLLRYVPVACAVLMTAFRFARNGAISPQLTWLILAVAAIILVRQVIGARANEGVVRDLTHQRAQLDRQAFRDPLTELGNRKLFIDHATDALADTDDTTTAVILFDLDGFKAVNDTYGHATGDELLRTAAERLTATVRTNDPASRLDGDEFVVLLPGLVDDRIADTVANR